MENRGHSCAREASPLGCVTATGHGTNSEKTDTVADRYISRRELRALFPVSDMTIWRWQHDPHVAFPVPVKLGNNGRNFWWLPAIHDWEHRRRGPANVRAASPELEENRPSDVTSVAWEAAP